MMQKACAQRSVLMLGLDAKRLALAVGGLPVGCAGCIYSEAWSGDCRAALVVPEDLCSDVCWADKPEDGVHNAQAPGNEGP